MQVVKLSLAGLIQIIPTVHRDERGFFSEAYQQQRYVNAGIACTFVQDNHSKSQHGTLRGMHFQSRPGQAKLIRVVVGRIFDVAVDIRIDSPTYGQWEGVYLDAETQNQLFVPVGFAHGFCVISDVAEVIYKVSSLYDAKTEYGFRWDDKDVGIKWPIDDPLVSQRDATAPTLAEWRASQA